MHKICKLSSSIELFIRLEVIKSQYIARCFQSERTGNKHLKRKNAAGCLRQTCMYAQDLWLNPPGIREFRDGLIQVHVAVVFVRAENVDVNMSLERICLHLAPCPAGFARGHIIHLCLSDLSNHALKNGTLFATLYGLKPYSPTSNSLAIIQNSMSCYFLQFFYQLACYRVLILLKSLHILFIYK